MLRVYDTSHNAIQPLVNYQGLCISEEVNGETQISFSMPRTELDRIREEYYIRTPDNEFIIKEISINTSNDMVNVVAVINVEELKGTPIKNFESVEKTPLSCIQLALSYVAESGWIVQSNIQKKRTLRQTQKSIWDIIQSALDLYMAEISVDAINKVIVFNDKIGEDKGAYFMEDLNLRSLSVSSDTYDLVTRIYPVGANGLTIASVNDGKDYVDNNEYSNKVIAMYWEDNRYTAAESLRDDAIEKLETLAKPTRSYSATVIDLAAISGLDVFDYNVGDTIWLKSKTGETNEKHRIVSMQSYPQSPESNTCTLSTNLSSLVTYVSGAVSSAETVSLVTTQDGRIDSSKVDINASGLPAGGTQGQALVKNSDTDYDVTWSDVEGGGGLTIEEIEDQISIGSANIQDGAITNAKIGQAAITEANIADASISRAKIQDGAIGNAQIGNGEITGAKIALATIDSTHIADAAITTGKIQDLAVTTAKIANAAIGTTQIQDAAIVAAKIDDAAITSAKIDNLAVTTGKIADLAVTEGKIANLAVTNGKIANAAIDSAKIQDATITAAKIQDASITSAKILELDAGLIKTGTLETERLLITGKSEDGTIKSIVLTLNEINGTPQLSQETIDGGSLTDKTITADEIMSGSLSSDVIMTNAITADKIAANAITSDKIATNAITADKIAANSLTIGMFDPDSLNQIIQEGKDYTDAQIAVYGEFLKFDSSNGLTIGSNSTNLKTVISSDEMGFYNGANKVAYINGDTFSITNGIIDNRLRIGHYVFKPQATGNLSIVWEE